MHLTNAIASWLGSLAAFPALKNGWPRSNPRLAATAQELATQLAAVAPEDFQAALGRELRSQADAFLSGLERYRHHPYRRPSEARPVVWAEGTTRLLDYAPAGGIPLLVVPSLINRFYILDLKPERSLLRHLAAQGLRPLVVDWDRPGPVERGFGLTQYIAGRLDAAAEAASVVARGGKLAVLGYCMGGLLALALALRRQHDVSCLALLATPWDFHAEQAAQARLLGGMSELLAASWRSLGEIPVDVLQSFFVALDPLLALRKFTRFAALDEGSPEAEDFVALEDWLNDGVPLALPAARECLGGWYGANETASGNWAIAGSPVMPARFTRPSLVVVPGRDRIVPPGSAAALTPQLPEATQLSPPLGHIGMIAGSGAERMWQPLTQWLLRHAP